MKRKCVLYRKSINVIIAKFMETEITDSNEGIFFVLKDNIKSGKIKGGGRWFCNECWEDVTNSIKTIKTE